MKKLNPIIHYSVVLVIITAVVGLVLAGANTVTKEIIAKREMALQTEARAKVLGGLAYEQEVPLQEENATVWKYLVAGEPVAYATFAKGNGYGGEIEIMVGMDADFKVLGVDILSMSETPGLGTKAEEPSFLGQFVGKAYGVELGSEITAISGATVTSRAVTEIVNRGIDNTRNLISGGII